MDGFRTTFKCLEVNQPSPKLIRIAPIHHQTTVGGGRSTLQNAQEWLGHSEQYMSGPINTLIYDDSSTISEFIFFIYIIFKFLFYIFRNDIFVIGEN
jgi:hypothetical protein